MTPRLLHRLALLLCLLCPAAGALAQTAVPITITDVRGRAVDDAVAALVPLRGPLRARAGASAQIEQRDKQFVPAVTVVQTGTSVQFPNRDTVRHHVYSFSPAKNFEIKLYVGTPATPVVFDKPGVVVLGCNIHDHMVAWVNVVDTPWFAKSIQGKAEIAGVPTGDYELQVWHPRAPTQRGPLTQRVSVAPGLAPLSVQLPY
jgi:plastocyanin